MRAFVERLAGFTALAGCPRPAIYRSAAKVRLFLRDCKDFGLYEPGGPLHGLSAEFAVWLQDLPGTPGRGREPRGTRAAAGRDRPAALGDLPDGCESVVARTCA